MIHTKTLFFQGTKENPTIINAMDNYRMVGCVCAEEDTNIKWTWLSEVFVVVVQIVCTCQDVCVV